MQPGGVEALEKRLLLTSGPALISIIPNDGSLLVPNETVHTAPTQLTFRFSLDAGETIDPATLNAIHLTRSGGDGVFGNANDATITPGFIGIDPAHANQVVMRFSSPLPDDLYRITIVGSGSGALADAGSPPLKFNGGVNLSQDFRLALGPQVLSVVPQPVTRDASGNLTSNNNEIDVYFNEPLQTLPGDPAHLNPAQFELIATQNTAATADDQAYVADPAALSIFTAADGTRHVPGGVSYNPLNNEARIIFQNGSGPISINSLAAGAFRLRIGNSDLPLPAPVGPTAYPGDPLGTYAGADSLGALGTPSSLATRIFSNNISLVNQAIDPNLVFPGGILDPGHRDIPLRENHSIGQGGARTVFYTFSPYADGVNADTYGVDPTTGQFLHNQITATEKQTVREIFQLYSYYTGITAIELPSGGIPIFVGDLRALDPSIPPNAAGGLGGPGGVGINGNIDWGAGGFGSPFMGVAMHEIGHALGLPHNDDGPPGTVMNGGSESTTPIAGPQPPPIYPGLADIVNLQHGYEPNSNQIDLYKFSVNAGGTLNAETQAQRNGSTLDTLLTLYEEFSQLNLPANGAGVVNGDRFSVTDNAPITATFEFTNNPSLVDATTGKLPDGNFGVVFAPTSRQQDLAVSIALAVQNAERVAGLNATANIGAGNVQLAGPITVNAAFAPELSVTAARTMIARNDNYFGKDSFIGTALSPGVYYVAVTSTGNDKFDPNVAFSGWGGQTTGPYQLRLNFHPDASTTLTDPGLSLLVPAGGASAIPDKTSFTITDGTSPTGQPALLSVNPASGGSLAPGDYYYVVTAVNSSGYETVASNELSAAATSGNQTLQLSWSVSGLPGLTGYRIYRGTSAGAENQLVASLPSNKTIFSDNGLGPVSTASPPGLVRTVTITFYNGSAPPPASPGKVAVQLAAGDSQDQLGVKLAAAMSQALAAGGFNALNYNVSGGVFPYAAGTGRVVVGGGPTTQIVVDPTGRGALAGLPIVLWGDTQRDALVGNSGAGGAGAYNFWFNAGATVLVDKSSSRSGADAVEQVGYTAGAPATGGVFTLTYQGETTPPLSYNVPAATVQAALQLLPAIGPGNVSVAPVLSGPNAYTWRVTFQNALGAQSVSPITTNAAGVVVSGGGSALAADATITAGSPYNTIQAALQDPAVLAAETAGTLVNVRVEGNANYNLGIALAQSGVNKIQAGQTFQVAAGAFRGTFEFTTAALNPTATPGSLLADGRLAVLLPASGLAGDIAAAIVSALNATPLASSGIGGVTVANAGNDGHYWYVKLFQGQFPITFSVQSTPFNAVLAGVVRPTLFNNSPYLVGTDQFGNLLPDDSLGDSLLQLPKNVVLMVDAGAVFKLDHANIEAGSSAVSIDDSQSALQVLGVPGQPAVFTSYNDDNGSLGAPQIHPGIAVKAGDWGGLVFNDDSDLETLGIFLNNVAEADLNYGGGQVFVNGVPNFYDALYLNTARPTLANNLITNSASAAISANPNSFEVSRFGSDLAIRVTATPSDGATFRIGGTTFQFQQSVPLAQGAVAVPFSGLSLPQIATNVAAAINATLYAGSVDHAAALGAVVTLPGVLAFSTLSSPLAGANDSFTADYERFGPDVRGNALGIGGSIQLAADGTWQKTAAAQNTINGLFVRINTNAGASLDTLDVSAEFAATDIPYVLQENLVIHDDLGFTQSFGTTTQRIAGQLLIDPGVLVKLKGARIEADFGANVIAEGTPAQPIVLTSLDDAHYGGGGTFDTPDSGGAVPAGPGDWGGFYFAPTSSGSIDHALITYGGGQTAIEGGFGTFNAVEIHQAKVRIADSTLENNAAGNGGDRNGRIGSDSSTIFVLGAQPALVNNVIQNNQGAAISADVQSLSTAFTPDWGRATTPPGGYSSLNADLSAVPAGISGPLVLRYDQFDDNYGPLVRLNRIGGNAINGMVVRGSELEAASIWDDADVVHVLEGAVTVPNFMSVGGLRLQSSATQSLVVKAAAGSGLIASGTPLDISNRIGGEIQILGTPQHPVVLTSLKDDSVGAGLTPDGLPNNDTNNDGSLSKPAPGDWGAADPVDPNSSGGGIIFDQYSNDRNVAMIEQTNAGATPATAQLLGTLAPNQQSGDDNSRLGFQVNAFIGPQAVQTYTFQGTAGSQVWLNVTNTSSAFNGVLELVDANGKVLARSDDSGKEQRDAEAAGDPLLAGPLLKSLAIGNLALPLEGGTTGTSGMNFWSTNAYDPGFRVVLPGTSGGLNHYYVRVYAKGQNAGNAFTPGNGAAGGHYQLQVRLQEQVEIPGSTVANADIRYATTGIDVEGLPAHSPVVTNTSSQASAHGDKGGAQPLGDLITSDTSSLSVGGTLAGQVDWYSFQLTYAEIQAIAGVNGSAKTWSTMFDVGYADGLTRPNTEIDVYDSNGNLIYVGRDSNIADQQPRPNAGQDASNLSHSSFGQLDPYIGPVTMPTGVPKSGQFTYYVAIHADNTLPTALDGEFNAGSTNFLVRLEPADSINRVVEDHVGFSGGQTAQDPASQTPLWGNSPSATVAQLNAYATPYNLSDVTLFVTTGGNQGHLESVNPFSGVMQTDQGTITNEVNGFNAVAMRNDGLLYGLTTGTNDANSGQYVQIDTGTAAGTVIGSDNITTYDFNTANPPAVEQQNVGLQMNGMAFVQTDPKNRALYAVGSYQGGHLSQAYADLLYRLDPNTGAVLVAPTPGAINVQLKTAAPPTQPQPVIVTLAGQPLSEKLTGMAYIKGVMYAIGNLGNLYSLNIVTGNATLIAHVGSFAFQGLTAGPQDVEPDPVTGIGKYADDLFSTAGGSLIAFDTTGALEPIFSSDKGLTYSSSVSLGVGGVTTLAFSTLDYNLWHVTDHRKADAGHGINVAPDNSRNAHSANKPPDDAGHSYYFGLEPPPSAASDSLNSQSQPDAANYVSNASDYYSYNTPGGAYGSLSTNSFSLAGYSAADKPTVYFNYFLNTEDASSTSSTKLQTMFDSARLSISEDGGKTWNLLATNNPFRATFPNPGEAELPYYQSTGAETGSSDSGPGGRQTVQPLFDSTTTNTGWRQARVDLSDYAGQNNLQFRFDFSTAGTTLNPSDLSINAVTGAANPYANKNVFGNQFGQFQGANNKGNGPEHRGLANNHEGWYIDDIVVGFAERGEMATAPTAGLSSVFNVPVNPDPAGPKEVLTGPYQLEIRRGTEYAGNVDKVKPDVSLFQSFDTNERFADAYSIVAPAGASLASGETITLNDGVHSVTFEFIHAGDPLANPSYVPIVFSAGETAQDVANAIVQAINANTTLVNVSAADVKNGVQAIPGDDPLTNIVNLFNVAEVTSSTASYNRLIVSVAAASITESGPTNSTRVTLTREGNLANPLTVSLQAFDVDNGFSSPSLNVSLPLTATFAPNSATTTFTVTGVKRFFAGKELADGAQTVKIVAAGGGLSSVAGTLDVIDDPPTYPALSVSLGQTSAAQDSTTPILGSVTINTGPLSPAVYPNGLVVNLQSLNPNAATVSPATVTIPADGFTITVPFTVTPFDDGVSGNPGGRQTANIVATAAGFLSGGAALTVVDDTEGPNVDRAFGTTSWTSQGPAPITAGQSNVAADVPGQAANAVAGAIETVLPDPNDSSVVYVGAVNGGIWKTTNYNGAAAGNTNAPTWTPLTDNLPAVNVGGNNRVPSQSIGALQFAVDPSLTPGSDVIDNTLIAGIGRFSSFAFAGGFLGGLIRSTDGGASWTDISPAILQGKNISGVAERDDSSTGATTILAGANGFFTGSGGLYAYSGPTSTLINNLTHVVQPTFTALYENIAYPPSSDATSGLTPPVQSLPTASATGGALATGTYYYVVTAVSATGETIASNEQSIPVTGPTGQVTINWGVVAGATSYRIYRGTAAGGENILAGAVNGATTFTDKGAAQLIPFGSITDLVGDPGDPNRFYVASLDNATAPVNNGGLFTSADGGRTWINITPTGLTMQATGSNFNDNVRFAVHYDPSTATNALYFGYVKNGQLNALERTPGPDFTGASATWNPTAQATWQAMSVPTTNENGTLFGLQPDFGVSDIPGSQGIIHFSMAADPTDPNLIYVGGDRQPGPADGVNFPNSIGATNYTGRLFRGDASLPAVSQWTPLTNNFTTSGTAPHADSRHLAFDANGNLIEADDGGIYRRTNPASGAGDWFAQIGNLQITEAHSVAYDTLTGTALAGDQDTGTPEQDSPNSTVWTDFSQGDGGDVGVDNSNAAQSIRYTSFPGLGGGFPGGLIATTYDATNTLIGQSFPSLFVPGPNKFLGQLDSFPFVTQVAINAIDTRRMVVAGEFSVWESVDGGNNFAQVPSFAFPITSDSLRGAIIAYGGRAPIGGGAFQNNPDVLWVGSDAQVLLRSSAGGNLTSTSYAGGVVTALSIDPNDWRRAFVADANGQIWMTTDGGTTFSNITASGGSTLTQMTAGPTSSAFAPGQTTGTLYIGTQDGVYDLAIPNGSAPSAAWQRYGQGLPQVPVYSLKYVAGQQLLVAGTMGRGVFIASAVGDLTVSVSPSGFSPVADDAGTIPNELRISRDGPTSGDLVVSLSSSDPLTAAVPSTVTIPDGQAFIDVPVTVFDDPLAKYPASVIFTATGGSLNPISAVIDVAPTITAAPPEPNTAGDNDTPALTVTIAAGTILTGGTPTASYTATVSRNTPTLTSLTVALVNSDPLSISIPATVVIPAGQASATFIITAVDHFIPDVARFPTVTAAASGFVSGSGSLEVDGLNHVIQFNPPVPGVSGDVTMPRPQGEVILAGNQISNASIDGILVEGVPYASGAPTLPYQGGAVNTPVLNGVPLAPGVVIENNLIYGVAPTGSGIAFEGTVDPPNGVTAIAPYGRIVNNTIYGADISGSGVGSGSGTGILVDRNASPTILNNLLVNLASGRAIVVNSGSNVVGENLYQNDGASPTTGGAGIGSFAETPALYAQLQGPASNTFRAPGTDPLTANFYLTDNSVAIDSSINSLQDRTAMTSVTGPLGIPPSPIIAPGFDVYGQLRVDDPAVANFAGLGNNVYIDRGAVEHADLVGPSAALLAPVDNNVNDLNATRNVVFLRGQSLAEFTLQLDDGSGSGIYDASVTSGQRVDVVRDGQVLTQGVDYYFDYDNNNHIIHLVAASGVWLNGHQYDIYLDNGVAFDPANPAASPVGITDRAGNFLQANGPDGLTHFRLLLANATNSAPIVRLATTGPAALSMYENDNAASPTAATFSSATAFSAADKKPVALSVFDVDANGGGETLTLTATHGVLSLSASALAGLNSLGIDTSTIGNGTSAITILAPLGDASVFGSTPGINSALQGLTFTPDLNFDSHDGTLAVISLTINDNGNTPAPALTTTLTIPINVIAINDPPAEAVPASPISINEDYSLTLSSAAGNAVSVSDPDVPAGSADYDNPLLLFEETITLSDPTLGTLQLATTAGITFLNGTGNGQSALDFQGTLSAINAALDGLVFAAAPRRSGAETLQFATNDNGNIGVGPAPGYLPSPQPQTSTADVTVNIVPQLYAPSLNSAAVLSFPSIPEDLPVAGNNGGSVLAMLESDPSVQPTAITLNAPAFESPSDGIAVIGATQTANGIWQHKAPGAPGWTSFPAVSNASALLLGPNDLVRFLPNPKFDHTRGGVPTLTFVAWDGTYDLASGGADADGAIVDLTLTGTGGSTPFSGISTPATASLDVIPQPEAPALASSANLQFAAINEDAPLAGNAGSTVLSMLQSDPLFQPAAITLNATASPKYGIAVVGLGQTSQGAWQYELAGGGWTAFPAVANSKALLLDGNDLVRFLPNPKFDDTRGGAPTLSFVAWDETFDYVNDRIDAHGTTVNLTSTLTGGSTPFSSGPAATAVLHVNPLPEAPTLASTASLQFSAINEDAPLAGNAGSTVLAMLQSDPLFQPAAITLHAVASPKYGIAVVGLGQTAAGAWQYQLAGGSWTNFPAVSSANALLLDGDDLVRFVPNPKFDDTHGGAPTLSFIAWDETFDYVNNRVDVHGTTVDLTSTLTGGSTPFSSGSAVAAVLHVNPAAEAPTLNASAALAFASILEDPASNAGSSVLSMLQSDPLVQPNAVTLNAFNSPQYGIAVVGLGQTASGVWQYELAGGGWTNFPSVSNASALLLDGGDLVRFKPNANFNDFYGGAPSLSFVAWDETFDYVNSRIDVHGTTVDLTSTLTGGSTPFSSNSNVAKLSVKAVNDPPAVAGPTGPLAISPSSPFSLATFALPAFTASDPDALEGSGQIQVNIAASENGVAGGAIGLNQLAGVSIVSGANHSSSVTIQGSFSDVNAALAGLQYEQDMNFDGTAAVALSANDLGNSGLGPLGQPAPFALTSTPLVLSLTGAPIHRAPVLGSGSPTLPAILENVPPANVAPAGTSISSMLASGGANFLTVDAIAGGLPGIAVTGIGPAAGGRWQYSSDGVGWTTIASAALNQALLLPGSYQLRFWPDPGFAGNATLTFAAWDQLSGTAGSAVDLSGAGARGGFSAFSSATGVATLNVQLVNQPPIFALAAGQSVLENNTVAASGGSPGGSNAAPISLANFVTGLSPGQPIELQAPFSQSVTFTVSTDRPDLFLTQPTLDAAPAGTTTSTLHFRLKPDVFGTAHLTVTAKDNGGTANGGVDTTVAAATLNVVMINDPPTLDPISNFNFVESAAPAQQTVNLTGIGAGLGESQNLTVTAVSDNPAVVSNQSIVYSSPNSTGQLKFSPNPYASGTAHITVTVKDDGGAANGGVDVFTQTFTVNVQFVNDPPSFAKGADVAVNEDDPLTTVPGWATNISPGRGNGDVGQALTFFVNPANPSLFATQPSIAPATGDLQFQFVPYFNGFTNVSVRLQDNGGTANGGVDSSTVQTFTLTSNFVNDAPSFTAGPDQTVNENAPAQTVKNWASGMSPGPGANEAGQSLNFTVSSTNPSLFSAGPAVNPVTGTLTYTPAPNAFGFADVTVTLHDNGGTANGGVDSFSQTFRITVNFVNHAPSFIAGANQVVNENAPLQAVPWATRIIPGPPSENGEQLNFIISTDNDALFSVLPAIDPVTGVLTYQPAPYASGVANVSVALHDDGGTQFGGVDTSLAQPLQITVNFVNQPPSFTLGPNQIVDEDAPPQTAPNFATNLSPGPGANEAGQSLNFLVSVDNPGLFSALPSIDPAGALSYALAPNASGLANVAVRLHDNGGTANGGSDVSPPQSFTITANFVNDPPTFVLRNGDLVVDENAGPQSIASVASQASPGVGANEAGQTLNYTVTNDNRSLFSIQPSIDATGQLVFAPAAQMYGVATVTVVLHDDGGTAHGGSDVSAAKSFRIVVNAPPAAQSDIFEISFAATSSADAATGVLSNDADPDGDKLSAVLVSGPSHGTLKLNADGSFSFSPNPEFLGFDQFTYKANDGRSDSGVVTVEILGHDDGANIRKLYEQVLHRDPDQAGLLYWIDQIHHGATLADVGKSVFESNERLDPILTKYYEQFLLREPEPQGLAYWRDQVWKVVGGPEPVIEGMISSPEFFRSAGGTDSAWVTALYQRLLDRQPDSQGLQYWDNLLETHALTEYQVVQGFLSSDEYFTNLIDAFFETYLNREPTASEIARDLQQMKGGASQADIQFEIVNTDEYRNTPPPPPLGSVKRLA